MAHQSNKQTISPNFIANNCTFNSGSYAISLNTSGTCKANITFNNCEINGITVDKQFSEVIVSLINTLDEDYYYDIDLVYTYTCTFIPGEIPADRDIEPTPDYLEVKITPKEIVLFNDGEEVDRIPAEAFDNIDDVDFGLYENDAEEAVQEEEDIYDWQDDDYYEE